MATHHRTGSGARLDRSPDPAVPTIAGRHKAGVHRSCQPFRDGSHRQAMETFDAWFDRTLTESDVATIGITDPAMARRLVTLLEATPTSSGSRAPAQLDAA